LDRMPTEASPDIESASQRSTANSSGGLQVKIKNTFLELDDEDLNDNDGLRQTRRSKTCCAKLTNATTWEPYTEHVPMDDIDLDSNMSTSDSSLVDDTPTHDNVMMPNPRCAPCPYLLIPDMDVHRTRPHVLTLDRVTPVVVDCTRGATISADVPGEVPVSSGSEQFTLHIPLGNLGIDSSAMPQHSVTVENRFSLGDRQVIDFRVVIGPTAVRKASPAAPSMARLALPVTPPKKNVSVCCHWKNKGWCKYQSQCKFQHPAHKRGVGAQMPILGLCVNGQDAQMHFATDGPSKWTFELFGAGMNSFV